MTRKRHKESRDLQSQEEVKHVGSPPYDPIAY